MANSNSSSETEAEDYPPVTGFSSPNFSFLQWLFCQIRGHPWEDKTTAGKDLKVCPNCNIRYDKRPPAPLVP